jgi:tryptophan synthase beta subunit
MSLPTPYPGLVISYSYLWATEHNKGAEEGVKARPCAILVARQVIAGGTNRAGLCEGCFEKKAVKRV